MNSFWLTLKRQPERARSRRLPVPGSWLGGELRRDLLREKGEGGAVVGDLGEVEYRVGHAQLADLGEALGDDLRGADQHAVRELVDPVFRDLLGDAGAEQVVLHPG